MFPHQHIFMLYKEYNMWGQGTWQFTMMLMDEVMVLETMNAPISSYTEWHLLLGAKQT